jgi:hypothetical protein
MRRPVKHADQEQGPVLPAAGDWCGCKTAHAPVRHQHEPFEDSIAVFVRWDDEAEGTAYWIPLSDALSYQLREGLITEQEAERRRALGTNGSTLRGDAR